jgi:hypothetical protein
MQARPEYARPRVHAGLVPETEFSAYGSRVAIRSLPVHMAWDRETYQFSDAMSIGCLGVDLRDEQFKFFVLSHFDLNSRTDEALEY